MDIHFIPKLIESYGFCAASDVYDVQLMKAGMTNRSFSFYVDGKRYIIRTPGKGSSRIIDRHQEHTVYQVIAPLHISETLHCFDPCSGVKIASYMENARVCDVSSDSDIRACMKVLRSFHDAKLSVDHVFDLWERLEYYEKLMDGAAFFHSDYLQTKRSVQSLKHYLDAQNTDWTLCHIDSVSDNFLFVPQDDGSELVRLIDWEYAGMQDPHLDIAMFAVYSMMDRMQIEQLIDAYFDGACDAGIRLKIYCYIAVAGLVWSNWCEFKGYCVGELEHYAAAQYRYAKDYPVIFREAYRKEFGTDYEYAPH